MESSNPTQENPPNLRSKPFPFLLILLSLLVLLLLLSTGFFAYQNMQLTKQITELSKPIPSPTPPVVRGRHVWIVHLDV